MAKSLVDLRKYSDEDLIEELARRANQRKGKKPVRLCDECLHFKNINGGFDEPENYNPCQKGHTMSFRMPDSPNDYDWGFYKLVCKDRTEATKCKDKSEP